MNELALFAGAGGGILGGHLLGWRTVCAVEWESYPASVLCARQNDGLLPPFPIWDDVQTFDGKPWRGIAQVVSGGFPCQDISAAGKGKGITGERSSMWKHMARIIGEVRPQYVFVENSPMLTIRGLGVVLGDLSEMGFNAEWGVISAGDVGAPHLRERIWIVATNVGNTYLHGISSTDDQQVLQRKSNWKKENFKQFEGSSSSEKSYVANTNNNGHDSQEQGKLRESSIQATTRKEFDEIGRHTLLANTNLPGLTPCNQSAFRPKQQLLEEQFGGSGICIGDISNTNSERQQGQGESIKPISSKETRDRKTSFTRTTSKHRVWPSEPNVGRVVDGMASRVDRLKAIGNGQVSRVAATAWRILNEL